MHHRQTLSLLTRLTASSGRQEIVREVAHHLGGEDLTVLILDSETGTWSPASGLTPVVRFGDDLRAFIANCHQAGQHTGTLPSGPDGSTRPAIGILGEDRSSLLILLGGAPCTDALNEGRLVLPLLVADLGKQERSARVDRPPRKDGSLDERPLPAALRRACQEADRLTGNLALAERSMLHAALILSNAHADQRQRRTADHCRAAKTREANLNETPRALAEANLVPEHGLRSLAQQIAETFVSFCAIRFLSEDRRWLKVAAAGHHDRTLLAGIRPLFSTPDRVDGGLHGWVLRTDQPVLIPNVDLAECDAVKGEFRAHFNRFPVHSVLIVPLRAHHTPIGTLSIARDFAGQPFTIHDQLFLQGIASQLAMAVEDTHVCRQLTEREQRLLDLLERLQAAKVMERRQVVYEVHDGLAQIADSVHQHLQAFAHAYPPACPEGRAQLERTLNLAHRTVCEARDIVAGLRPTVLDDFGLAAAIGMLVEEFTLEGWEISYHEDLEDYRVPPLIELHLYRVALEALANVRKHAGTRRVRVRLRHERETISLEVHDWGKGFVRDSASLETGNGAHLGLSSMRERIRWLGGRFALESQPGRGTTVTAEVPLCLTMPGVVTGIEASTPADC